MSELQEARKSAFTTSPDKRRSFRRSWLTLVAALVVALLVSAAAELSWPLRSWTGTQLIATLRLLVPLWVLVIQVYILYRLVEERTERERVMEDLNSFRISVGRSNYMQ